MNDLIIKLIINAKKIKEKIDEFVKNYNLYNSLQILKSKLSGVQSENDYQIIISPIIHIFENINRDINDTKDLRELLKILSDKNKWIKNIKINDIISNTFTNDFDSIEIIKMDAIEKYMNKDNEALLDLIIKYINNIETINNFNDKNKYIYANIYLLNIYDQMITAYINNLIRFNVDKYIHLMNFEKDDVILDDYNKIENFFSKNFNKIMIFDGYKNYDNILEDYINDQYLYDKKKNIGIINHINYIGDINKAKDKYTKRRKGIIYFNENGNTDRPINNRYYISNNHDLIKILAKGSNYIKIDLINSWTSICYLINSSNYILLKNYLDEFLKIHFKYGPLNVLSLNKTYIPFDILIDNLKININNLINSFDNIEKIFIPKLLKIIGTNQKIPINVDQLLYISNNIIFGETYKTSTYFDFNDNINNYLNNKINDNEIIDLYDYINKFNIKNKDIVKIDDELFNLHNKYRKIFEYNLKYVNVKFINNTYAFKKIDWNYNLINYSSHVLFFMFEKIYYIFLKNIINDNDKYYYIKKEITDFLIVKKYYIIIDEKIMINDNEADKENILIKIIRYYFKINTESKLADYVQIQNGLDYYMELIINIIINYRYNENDQIILFVRKLNKRFVDIVDLFFNHLNILLDNKIRSITNIYNILETTKVISDYLNYLNKNNLLN